MGPTEPDSHDLRKAARGHRDALARVVRAWAPRVRAWALADTGDPVHAEDAAQEALIRLCRFVDRYDARQPFAPWLRTLTRNAALDVVRKRARVDERVISADVELSVASDPGHALDLDRGARRAVAAAVATGTSGNGPHRRP